MQVFLALYDPAYSSADGSYWTWHAPELSREVLDEVYYEHLRVALPEDTAELTPNDEILGIATTANGWRCYYRIASAGRDQHNRPGRFVAVCAFALEGTTEQQNPEAIWRSQEFLDLVAAARQQCPVRQPQELSFFVSDPREQCDAALLAQLRRDGQLSWPESGSWEDLLVLCANLPVETQWQVQLHRKGSVWQGLIQRCGPNYIDSGCRQQQNGNHETRLNSPSGESILVSPKFRWMRFALLAIVIVALLSMSLRAWTAMTLLDTKIPSQQTESRSRIPPYSRSSSSNTERSRSSDNFLIGPRYGVDHEQEKREAWLAGFQVGAALITGGVGILAVVVLVMRSAFGIRRVRNNAR